MSTTKLSRLSFRLEVKGCPTPFACLYPEEVSLTLKTFSLRIPGLVDLLYWFLSHGQEGDRITFSDFVISLVCL